MKNKLVVTFSKNIKIIINYLNQKEKQRINSKYFDFILKIFLELKRIKTVMVVVMLIF